MSAKHTPESLHDFAVKHAPALSAEITRLCGCVIAKGMTGIIEEACRLQLERDDLLEALIAVRDRTHTPDVWERVNAAIAKATGAQP